MKDVTSLISLVYYGFDVNGNSIKRVVTKDVEPILLNGLKQQGLLYIFMVGGGGNVFNSYKTFSNTNNTINRAYSRK